MHHHDDHRSPEASQCVAASLLLLTTAARLVVVLCSLQQADWGGLRLRADCCGAPGCLLVLRPPALLLPLPERSSKAARGAKQHCCCPSAPEESAGWPRTACCLCACGCLVDSVLRHSSSCLISPPPPVKKQEVPLIIGTIGKQHALFATIIAAAIIITVTSIARMICSNRY